jgi:hypothetical protein
VRSRRSDRARGSEGGGEEEVTGLFFQMRKVVGRPRVKLK